MIPLTDPSFRSKGLRRVRIVNQSRGYTLAENAEVADTYLTRLAGLLGRGGLEPGQGLVLTRTGSVHMFFMSFALDIVFLSRDGQVVRAIENLRPWAVSPIVRGAKTTLELPVGVIRASGTRTGDTIEIESLG